MSDIAKRNFAKLAVDGSNYLTWTIDAENRLEGMSLDHTITRLRRVKMSALNLIKQMRCMSYVTILT